MKSKWNCSKRPAMVLNTWKKFFQEKQHRRGFYINSPFFKEGTPVSLKRTFEGMGNLRYNTIISIYNKVGTESCLVDADETYVTKGFFNIQMSLIKISHCLRMPYRIFISKLDRSTIYMINVFWHFPLAFKIFRSLRHFHISSVHSLRLFFLDK